MPSTNQQGSDTEYKSDQHRLIDNNSNDMIEKIKPERIETAQKWIKAASQMDRPELIDHFKAEIKRLRE